MCKLKSVGWFLILVLLVSGAVAVAWRSGLLGQNYTATASLEVAQCKPRVLARAAEKYDPAEFESFRDTQMQLLKSRFVLMAAFAIPGPKTNPALIVRTPAIMPSSG